MADFLQHGAVANAVNMPNITAEEAPRLKPYIALASQLGYMASQMVAEAKAMTITYSGDAATINTKPVTATALAAFFAPSHVSVNVVNAPAIAKQMGFGVTEATRDAVTDHQTLMEINIEAKNGTLRLVGTLVNGKPRLVRYNDISIEAALTGHMLLTVNDDAPGFIGRLGTALGEAGINIASFHLGRDKAGGTAVALLAVDQAITPPVTHKIAALAGSKGTIPLRFA
jgi:D-3-phosphoglycerate dehydrogenase